jgi:hypothetical protein
MSNPSRSLRVSVRQALLICLLAILAITSGCNRGPRTVTVTGNVLRDGQPIAVSPTGYIQVTLQPDVSPETPFTPRLAECDRATGKFQFTDIPPGKYKVGIEQFDPTPQNEKLNGAFRADTGKIIREIDGKTPLTIDIAKPTGG